MQFPPEKSTPVARRGRRARSLSETVRPPKAGSHPTPVHRGPASFSLRRCVMLQKRRQAYLLLLPLLTFAACDATGPDGNTRVVLSQAGSSGSNAVLIPTTSDASKGD